VVSHFPNRVYNGLEDLAEKIMNPPNCHSTRINMNVKDNYDFASPKPVYVYTDIVKPNLVGDSYVKILTTLHFPSVTGYHWFDHSMYTPIEQSVIEAITIRLVTKNG
jgi:hypothetical protein